MGRTLRIGGLAAIPTGIQPLWLLVVGPITYSLGHDYDAVQDRALSSGAACVLGLRSVDSG